MYRWNLLASCVGLCHAWYVGPWGIVNRAHFPLFLRYYFSLLRITYTKYWLGWGHCCAGRWSRRSFSFPCWLTTRPISLVYIAIPPLADSEVSRVSQRRSLVWANYTVLKVPRARKEGRSPGKKNRCLPSMVHTVARKTHASVVGVLAPTGNDSEVPDLT